MSTLAACGDDEGYPQEATDRFVKSCAVRIGATEEECRCTIDRLEKTMPYDEFERADEALREDRAMDPESQRKLAAAAKACRQTG